VEAARLIWADGGYAGQLIAWVRALRKRNAVRLEIVKRSDDVKGFKVLPRRWVVERTFGWLGRQRRLSKDYEYLTDTSETMIYVSMIGLMLRRLANGAFEHAFRKGRPPVPTGLSRALRGRTGRYGVPP
jgi:putative transposase